jgi:extracellular solute-binding protein (family 5)
VLLDGPDRNGKHAPEHVSGSEHALEHVEIRPNHALAMDPRSRLRLHSRDMSATAAKRILSLGGVLTVALGVALVFGGAGCGRPPAGPVTRSWWVGRTLPAFDPLGPRDPVRWSLERLLTSGLVEEDPSGVIVPAAAERIVVSRDSLTYAFHLRQGLRYTNGSRCRSADFRAALERGLQRTDHGTTAWALAAVRGVDAVRPGRALPPLGIVTPDDTTLVLELARKDRRLLRKLAIPGLCAAWTVRDSVAGWGGASGLGPYRLQRAEPRRLVLVRARPPAKSAAQRLPDTLSVRFEPVVARIRSALRAGRIDLLWPVPGALLAEPLPQPYRHATGPATPQRRLLLLMRLDVPPTSKVAARTALAHGLNRSEVTDLLKNGARDPVSWWPGATPFEFPRLDAQEVASWLERGRLGRSVHVTMLLDADGVATVVAPSLQGEWARLSLSVDLMALRGESLADESLRGWKAQLALLEWQSLIDDPAADLAALVMPVRGPAVGSFRTGWRTREFDPWIRAGSPAEPLDLDAVERRLAEQLVALPVAEIDWMWIDRSGPATASHPHFGPEIAPLRAPATGNVRPN